MLQKKDSLISIYASLMDIFGLVVSYLGALGLYWIINGRQSLNDEKSLFIILVAFFIVELVFNRNQYIIRRGKLEEVLTVVKQALLFFAFVAVISLAVHDEDVLSRLVLLFTVCFYVILDIAGHLVLKTILFRRRAKHADKILLVCLKKDAGRVIHDVNSQNMYGRIDSCVIVDEDMTGQVIEKVPVVAGQADMFDYAKREVVDEVLILCPYERGDDLVDDVKEFQSMGMVVHVAVEELAALDNCTRSMTVVGSYPVLTFSKNVQDVDKALIKRLIDILAGIVGSILTLILTIFIGPAICIESPGPIFFKQKRVGRNGRYFYMYKFRSMYPDAERQKDGLMSQNEMNGLMFKMTDDPRITRVGRFIRATSLDEFPQFFNILRGDMSLIGTRPPTVDEFRQYKDHHKSRLAMKPGLTGMWQVSGRSDITDFEEVVRLDNYYINNWSLTLDLKIFFKTILAVVKRAGSK